MHRGLQQVLPSMNSLGNKPEGWQLAFAIDRLYNSATGAVELSLSLGRIKQVRSKLAARTLSHLMLAVLSLSFRTLFLFAYW